LEGEDFQEGEAFCILQALGRSDCKHHQPNTFSQLNSLGHPTNHVNRNQTGNLHEKCIILVSNSTREEWAHGNLKDHLAVGNELRHYPCNSVNGNREAHPSGCACGGEDCSVHANDLPIGIQQRPP
jgi:hypothetical protein